MFGDARFRPGRTERQLAAHADWLLARHGRVAVIELGAGTAVPTVRRQAEVAAAATGALIRINVREPQIRHGRGVQIAAPAAEALARLDALL